MFLTTGYVLFQTDSKNDKNYTKYCESLCGFLSPYSSKIMWEWLADGHIRPSAATVW